MPELPEVEVLVRHLNPALTGKTIRAVAIRRRRVIRPTLPEELTRALCGASILGVARRGKYLLFQLARGRPRGSFQLLAHLGMTGRMYLLPTASPLPKHAAVVLDLGKERFVFEDTRYFGRFSLDMTPVAGLGPEPLDGSFTTRHLHETLKRSNQPVKVKLLDQSLVAGVGNIYASEALHRAGISPATKACRISSAEAHRLWKAIRLVLRQAIRFGSTVPLDFIGTGSDRLFYYGQRPGSVAGYEERLRVYNREGLPCLRCGALIRRRVQAGRSTFSCPSCQGRGTLRYRASMR